MEMISTNPSKQLRVRFVNCKKKGTNSWSIGGTLFQMNSVKYFKMENSIRVSWSKIENDTLNIIATMFNVWPENSGNNIDQSNMDAAEMFSKINPEFEKENS